MYICIYQCLASSSAPYQFADTLSLSKTHLAKPHPILPAASTDTKLVLCVQMADVPGPTILVLWQLKTQKNFYRQGTLCNKGKNNCQRQRQGIPRILAPLKLVPPGTNLPEIFGPTLINLLALLVGHMKALC